MHALHALTQKVKPGDYSAICQNGMWPTAELKLVFSSDASDSSFVNIQNQPHKK